MHTRKQNWQSWLRGLGVALVLLLLPVLYGREAAQTSQAAERADVVVTIWPTPSLVVARGDRLLYEIRVRNDGAGRADQVDVRLPYDRHALTIEDAYFDNSRDWVNEIERSSILVSFRELDEDDERVATLFFRVSGVLPEGAVVNMWAGYGWENEVEDEEGLLSNAAPVVVGVWNENSGEIPLLVEPVRGQRSSVFTFSSDRFLPDEEITAWLNTMTLPEELDFHARTDNRGRIRAQFSNWNLEPGAYSLVLYGNRSALSAVGAFIVEPDLK